MKLETIKASEFLRKTTFNGKSTIRKVTVTVKKGGK
jgi:hypothetical protein